MLTFTRTSDLEFVARFLTHPSIWRHVKDDYSGTPEDWRPNPDPRIWYVQALEDGTPIGLFTFLPRSRVLWEAHVALVKSRETSGDVIAEAALRWMFESSSALRIVAEIPASNRLAVRLCEKVMRYVGIQPRAFMRNGRLEALVLFGVSEGDSCPA